MSTVAPPQTPLGELTALPQTPYLDLGRGRENGGLRAGEIERGKERGKGGKGEEGERIMIRTPLSKS